MFQSIGEKRAAVSRAGCVGYGCQEGAVGFLWLFALPPLFSFFVSDKNSVWTIYAGPVQQALRTAPQYILFFRVEDTFHLHMEERQ